MIKRIKTLIASIAAAGMLAFPMLLPVAVSAQGADIQGNLCGGANSLQINGSGNCGDTSAENSVNKIITFVINTFSIVVSIIAVIMIIVGGVRYITSGGAQDKVSGAKNTILYAIIGLIVVALAQILVRYVLNKATQQ